MGVPKLKRRVNLKVQEIYDSYILMYVYLICEDPQIGFECLWQCEAIKNKFLYELENACFREIRHMEEQCYSYRVLRDRSRLIDKKEICEICDLIGISYDEALIFKKHIIKLVGSLNAFYGEDDGCSDENRYLNKLLTLEDFQGRFNTKLNLMDISLIFSKFIWRQEYAGEGWAKIAETTHMLRNASPSEFFYIFDRAIDLVHNNGTILSKMRVERGFEKALDIKAMIPNAKSILDLCSHDVKRIYAMAMRDNQFWFHESKVNSITNGLSVLSSIEIPERRIEKGINIISAFIPKRRYNILA